MCLKNKSVKHLPATGLVYETDAHLALSSKCTEAVSIRARSMVWARRNYFSGCGVDKERRRNPKRESVHKETPCCDHSR